MHQPLRRHQLSPQHCHSYHSRCLLNQRHISRSPLLRFPERPQLIAAQAVGAQSERQWTHSQGASPREKLQKASGAEPEVSAKANPPGTLRKAHKTTLSTPSTNPKQSQTMASGSLFPNVILKIHGSCRCCSTAAALSTG